MIFEHVQDIANLNLEYKTNKNLAKIEHVIALTRPGRTDRRTAGLTDGRYFYVLRNALRMNKHSVDAVLVLLRFPFGIIRHSFTMYSSSCIQLDR